MKTAKVDFIKYAVNAVKTKYGALLTRKPVGVPINELSLEWLIEMDGWPLGRYTQSAGQFASHKSCFIFWLMKLYLDNGGIGLFIDTENKLSIDLLKSVLGDAYCKEDGTFDERVVLLTARSIDEWQRILTDQLNMLKQYKEETSTTPNVPILWAIDSMTGATTESTIEQLKQSGEAAGRAYPEGALMIAQYMQAFTDMLVEWPVTIHCSRHEKPNIGTVGSHSLGGHAPDFYATYDIRFKHGPAQTWMGKAEDYIKGDIKARTVTLSIRKSSFGSDIDKVLHVLFCWKFVNGKQVSWWDWRGSTAMLLAQYNNVLKNKLGLNIQHEARRGTANSIGGEYFWCNELGISANDALSAPDFGTVIEKSDLRKQIAEILEIKHIEPFNLVTEPTTDKPSKKTSKETVKASPLTLE